MKLRYLFLFIILLLTPCMWSQSKILSKRTSSSAAALEQVEKSIKDGQSDLVIAQNYEQLAQKLTLEKNYAKAEEYWIKARKLYEKLKDKTKIANIDRERAILHETQNNLGKALDMYKVAEKNSVGSMQKSVNRNDAFRLQNKSDKKSQAANIQQNIDIFAYTSDQANMSNAYQQMAQVEIEMDNKDRAIENLNLALDNTLEPVKTIEINREIANIYAADGKFDKAIDINKKMVEEAKETNNAQIQIEQLQNLSSVYFDNKNDHEGFETLQEAYTLAVNEGRTLDAKNSLLLLVDRYNKDKKTKKAMEVYADFVNHLEPLIKSDSTLIDAKAFQVHEERISQLEKERELKDQLIERKNTFTYVLIISIILILVFLILIAKTLYSIKKKNKRIALQSLRREMNPHFIFNSLNSVNQFIAQNNELEANKYLSSYSKLMRNIMENSNKDFVTLSSELEQLKEYLDLEYMRFHDKFEYKINIDDNIDTDSIFIPNMLLQPQLENAIWHGLRYKDTFGLLTLTIKPDKKHILAIVEDNGIGLTKSEELKTKHQRNHQSRGMTNTTERINLLNDIYKCDISLDISEKEAPHTGVIVIFRFPLMLKK